MRQHRPLQAILGLAFIATLGAQPYFSPRNAIANEESMDQNCEAVQLVLIADTSGSTKESAGESENIQERGMPRIIPGGTPAAQIEGGIFDGNRLRAKPGYILEPRPGGTAVLRPNTGGNGFDLSCRCGGGKGKCELIFSEGSARCYSPNGGCTGNCEMRGTFGSLSSGGLRIQ